MAQCPIWPRLITGANRGADHIRATAPLTGVGWPALALTALLGHEIVLALYGPTWLASVPAILPLSLAAAVAMTFHYIPTAMAIGRPYLSAVPVLVYLATRIAFGVALFDGGLALCLGAVLGDPRRHADHRHTAAALFALPWGHVLQGHGAKRQGGPRYRAAGVRFQWHCPRPGRPSRACL